MWCNFIKVKTMLMYSIGELGKQIVVTPQTLRNRDKKGELKPALVSQDGTRYYF